MTKNEQLNNQLMQLLDDLYEAQIQNEKGITKLNKFLLLNNYEFFWEHRN